MKDKTHGQKEPFVRISRRGSITTRQSWTVRAIAILLALIVCGFVIMAIVHMNPIDVYIAMFQGSFGTGRRLWITLRDMALLLLVGVALAPAFKMKFWNLGGEGQLLMGGVVTAACMLYLTDLPAPILFVVMFITSAVAGAIWGVIPAFFKAKFNTNEVLFTLMMNYVAIQITAFFVAKWENPYGSNTVGIINSAGKQGWMPEITGAEPLITIVIVLIIAIAMFVYLDRSKQGYEITVVGDSENTARYAGIDVKKVIIRTMLISGAICGITGSLCVSASSHTISTAIGDGRGFTAIIVAWLARFNTVSMIAISLLLVFLDNGAVEIASRFGLNDYASQMITGIILFFILGCEFFINYRLSFRGKKEKED